MKLIKQEDVQGCGIACLAMVTGKTYQEVLNDFMNDFEQQGMSLEGIMEYLKDFGYLTLYKSALHYQHNPRLKKDMIKPFADMHIVRILQFFDAEQGHLVVMDNRGKFLCPGGMSDKQVREAYAITDVVGVYSLDFEK